MTATLEITEPGLVTDMPIEQYLADPVAGGSLSHSGMKTIVKQTPALYAYEREHGRPTKDEYDRGHVVHKELFGSGPDVVIVDAENWTRKADQQTRREARDEGSVCVLRSVADEAQQMVAAIRSHPLAGPLFDWDTGQPEVSAFAPDPKTGVWLRARFDWLRPPATVGGRLIVVDYKTSRSAHPDKFTKNVHEYGYDIQDAVYQHIAETLGLAEQVAMVFCVQEVTPPYLVNVVQLPHSYRRIGEVDMRRAIDTYKTCTETGVWPGYGDEITFLDPPVWIERQYESEF